MNDPEVRPPWCAALLTAVGRSAVATIGVRGLAAVAAVDPLFRSASGRSLADQPLGRIAFGRLVLPAGGAIAAQDRAALEAAGSADAGRDARHRVVAEHDPPENVAPPPSEVSDEVVVCRISPELVEIHCHGGQAAPRAVLRALAKQGCEIVDWKSWIVDYCGDPLEAAARIALAEARTERAALILLDQLNGALRRRLHRAIHALEEHAEATEAPALAPPPLEAAEAMLERLLDVARVGCRLLAGFQIALAGPPNAGKSRLLNALVGYERAIVFDAPGTTRDIVSADTAIDGWPAKISDTAGLREAAGPIEQAGITLANRAIDGADVVLLVFDRSIDWSPADQQVWKDVAARVPPERIIVVHNKLDLPPGLPAGRPDGWAVSALSGAGLESLLAEISRRLAPVVPLPGEAVPFLAEQQAAIASALEAVRVGARRMAAGALGRLLAAVETVSDGSFPPPAS